MSQLNAVASPGRLNKAALQPFLSIQQSELQGEVYILPLPSHLNTQGVSLVQHRAYEGAGQGLGTAASFSRYFELRARGIAYAQGTQISYWNASDYRFVP